MAGLFIDKKGIELKLKGEVLICYENEKRVGTIPINPIDRIYLKGNVKIQSSLLAKLGEKGIGVISLHGRQNKPTLFLPQPHNDAYRRIAQYVLANNELFCVVFSKQLIQLKFLTQQMWLKEAISVKPKCTFEIEEQIKLLTELSQKVQYQKNLASLRGIEGIAAKQYFSTLAQYLPSSLKFSGRNRRPPKDPFNVALSLAYTLLHSEAVFTCYANGLDPYIGFYHALDFGRESLACDLIEPLRPLVDDWLIKLFQQKELRVEYFSNSENGCFLTKAGRVNFYKAYEQVVKKWRKILSENCLDITHLLQQLKLLNMPQRKSQNFLNITESLTDFEWQKLLAHYYFNQCNLLQKIEFKSLNRETAIEDLEND